ncbi:lysophospholipase [Bacillus sp. BGMRC 2118]|nr:lysophospholipase [Bacillus sp. BGMRC 2118]
MIKTLDRIRLVNGEEIFHRIIKPNGFPKAAIIVIHGHGDHSGGLDNLYSSLIEYDYIVYAFDLRGHGRSTGKRGFIKDWIEYRDDLNQFHKFVVTDNPDLPIFIVGHSLGGVIALDYILYHQENINGIITIAPAISYRMTKLEKLMIRLLAKLNPALALQLKGNSSLLTNDQSVLDRISSDELRHNVVTPGLGNGLLEAVSGLMKRANSINLPLLLQYGLEDKITPPQELRLFFNLVASTEKKIHEYEKMKHRPFDDIDRELFLSDMINWLEQRVKAPIGV